MTKEMKLVYLEWEDAVATAEWMFHDELEQWTKDTKMTVQEVGWIIKETKEYIVMVGRLADYDGDGFTDKFGAIQKIPKTWIRNRVDLTDYVLKKIKK